jgi:hypothetical protein
MRRIRKLFDAYFFENKMILAGLTSQKNILLKNEYLRINTDMMGVQVI